ncbi:hypothetical protein [Enterococcus gallinarum]|uniref:hypothetical protein n=1 Tax=Enterococcus gallinarum TaxID=1353 RepID=UPI0027E11019|nr:hypothetical protein [Enterococcus gallinarum]MDQ6112994.1 hypothetical protein [Enterococcus gallinarum]
MTKKNSDNSMKKKKFLKQFAGIGNANVKFICLSCGEKESIPRDVVKFLDDVDIANDPNNPPKFTCEKCGKEIYPEYYRNALGIEFKISDVQ